MTQIVNKWTTSPSVINALVSGRRCQFKLLIWLECAWKPTKWIGYEWLDLPICTADDTHAYQTWTKNVRDHYAKPNQESFILNLLSILGTLQLLYFNKLVLGLINFKLGDFQSDPLEVKNCSNHESHCATVWLWHFTIKQDNCRNSGKHVRSAWNCDDRPRLTKPVQQFWF